MRNFSYMAQDLSTDYGTLINKLHSCSEILKPILLNFKSIQEAKLYRQWKAMIRFYGSCQELISTIEHAAKNLLHCLIVCQTLGRKLFAVCHTISHEPFIKVSRIVHDCLDVLSKYVNNLRWA